jgi:very-short-patch-repair endonuclease
MKYSVVMDVNKQYWTYFLKDIPTDPENITLYYRDRVEEEISSDLQLLKVHKPDFQQCPKPPEVILKWLVPGWDRFKVKASFRDTLEASDEISHEPEEQSRTEHFYDDDTRVRAYEKWIDQREKWVEKQKLIDSTRAFFGKLFQAYTDVERESETLEFMVGEGIVQDKNNSSINHPVLLKRMKFEFDGMENTISIVDTDTEPELYTLLLQNIENINYGVVRQLKEDLREFYYHPLDRNDTPDYLKTLTHRLCSESIFIREDVEKPGPDDRIITRTSPVYFIRRRIDGTLKAIEEIISNIETTGEVPGHLIDIVGGGKIDIPDDTQDPTIEGQLAALSGENVEILLSKEANREQLEIAERIEQYNAVLVQGPPGTGKTHTIANLLGHFLAQGKNVLVTSQTKKALSVLKGQVPYAMQDLCVSVLDDTNLDMTRSIDGISEYLSRYTSRELKRKMESAERQRKEVFDSLSQVRKRIYAIKYKEFKPIVYNGNGYSPSEVANYVNLHAEELSDIIPGKVTVGHPLPVSIEELHTLYKTNSIISEDVEDELACELPSSMELISPVEFEKDVNDFKQCENLIRDIGQRLSISLRADYQKNTLIISSDGMDYVSLVVNPTEDSINELSSFINTFKTIDGWMINASVDGKRGGGYKRNWELLIESIEDTVEFAGSIVTKMLGKKISITGDIQLSQLKDSITKLHELFSKKGKISKLNLMFNKQLEVGLSQVHINGKPISTLDDCILVENYITLRQKREETAILWDELISKFGTPDFFSLGSEPEEICLQHVPVIRKYLNWYQSEYTQLIELVNKSGLNSSVLFTINDLDSELGRTEKILNSVRFSIPLFIQATRAFMTMRDIDIRRRNVLAILSQGSRVKSTVCIALSHAVKETSCTDYEHRYHQLSLLYAKYAAQRQRLETLSKVAVYAPAWAHAITNREGIHGETICPEMIEDAWKWKQFAGIVEEITSEPFEEYQKKAIALSKEFRSKTTELAANSAWYHLVLRTEQNIEMKQALIGWKLTVKKIGKGTGKNAPMLRRQAREKMAKCQAAVPAWIMPVSRALESLDPSQNSFDIIIVDEASQSDVSSLAILYMAKKVIIVGDDKQVSPMAVGVDISRMNNLREMYIKDVIPNWDLFDAKTSLYDIAGTTYQPLMLREHFRCVPEIIGYSNKLSYDFKIKPLRDASKSIVTPPVVSYRVDNGRRDGRRKTNQAEAEMVVALMLACIEQNEYNGETFGAISLLGDEQAKLIQQYIFKQIDPSIIEERRILCGNASHFQGDERGVIFLSMVDSNDDDGTLRITGEGVEQSTKQRYNVAASRAKNQLWIIHSLDYSKDLQNGDIRRDLLEYAENPKAYAQLAEQVVAKSDSPFEEAVGKSLVAAGYHLVQQWEVGAYHIDMVACYEGQKIAIECDGERYHSGEEKIRADMERQTILERMGWRFIRIRGSEYYRDPEGTMERVIKELNEYGIYPESMVGNVNNMSSMTSELLSRVKIRATQIIDEWHSDDPSYKVDTVSGETIEVDVANIPPIVVVNQELVKAENHEKPSKIVSNKSRHKMQDNERVMLFNEGAITTNTADERRSFVKSNEMPSIEQNKTVSLSDKKKNDVKCFVKCGDDIVAKLDEWKIPFIDTRAQHGSIWVVYSLEYQEQFENLMKESTYKYSDERRGSLSTGNRRAWRINIG